MTLKGWTAEHFAQDEALIFVGAVGIAVRAIAPYCKSKAADPAVVVVDEGGNFAVPLLSGHLGGANALARALAKVCGAVPVITTATDVNGLFAVDLWAKAQNCAVLEPERIKRVSGALLAGQTVRYWSPWPVAGEPPPAWKRPDAPEAADFALTLTPQGGALHLVPRIGVLGVGCRRGTTAQQLEEAFAAFCAASGLSPAAVSAAASIDLKKMSRGLQQFCKAHGWPITFYPADELRAVPGQFTPSAFVASVTGVDNVCERAAVKSLGRGAPSAQNGRRRRDAGAGRPPLCTRLEDRAMSEIKDRVRRGAWPRRRTVSDRAGAERLAAGRGVVRLYGLHRPCAPLYPEKSATPPA